MIKKVNNSACKSSLTAELVSHQWHVDKNHLTPLLFLSFNQKNKVSQHILTNFLPTDVEE